MPRRRDMGWEPRTRRWRKMYRGVEYTVSCKQLEESTGERFPHTKEGSAPFANAWWRAKRAEIDMQAPIHPQADLIIEYRRRAVFERRHGREGESAEWEEKAKRLEQGGGEEQSNPGFPIDWEGMVEDTPELQDILWRDRYRHDPAADTPPERTVGALVGRYLGLELGRHRGGEISVSEYDIVRLCLEYFRDWAGADSPIAAVDAERWEDYHAHLMGCDASVEYKKKRLRHARNFLAWAGGRGVLEIPKNLHSSKLRFKATAKKVPIMTVEVVRRLIDEAGGRMRLCLLLMVNCGMTQEDVNELRRDEVDLKAGRIVRKRSKTGHIDSVPTVDYRLWPPTLSLLQKYAERAGEYVLLTESGDRWVVDEIGPDGKRRKRDHFATRYRYLRKKLRGQGIEVLPAKVLRKTSASLLDAHESYGRYVQEFLGHAPESIADRHYRRSSPEVFDRAIAWLGEQYGLT